MATATFTIGPLIPEVHIKFFNVKTNKPYTIQVRLDTGGYMTTLAGEHAAPLGVKVTDGKESSLIGQGGSLTTYEHTLVMQVGNLKPVETDVLFLPSGHGSALGRVNGLSHYSLTMAYNTVSFTEYSNRNNQTD